MSKIETSERHMSVKGFFEITEEIGIDGYELLKRVSPEVLEAVMVLLDQKPEVHPELQKLVRTEPVWKV
jgi:hypothetical protein